MTVKRRNKSLIYYIIVFLYHRFIPFSIHVIILIEIKEGTIFVRKWIIKIMLALGGQLKLDSSITKINSSEEIDVWKSTEASSQWRWTKTPK